MATTTATTISIAAMADRYHVVDGVDLKKKQKAIVTPELRSILDLRLVETTIEPPKSDEVVVKIECTGICGSVSQTKTANTPPVQELIVIQRMSCSLLAPQTGYEDQTTLPDTRASGGS